MAERVGFEPTVPARVHLISSQARSASSGTSPETVTSSNGPLARCTPDLIRRQKNRNPLRAGPGGRQTTKHAAYPFVSSWNFCFPESRLPPKLPHFFHCYCNYGRPFYVIHAKRKPGPESPPIPAGHLHPLRMELESAMGEGDTRFSRWLEQDAPGCWRTSRWSRAGGKRKRRCWAAACRGCWWMRSNSGADGWRRWGRAISTCWSRAARRPRCRTTAWWRRSNGHPLGPAGIHGIEAVPSPLQSTANHPLGGGPVFDRASSIPTSP